MPFGNMGFIRSVIFLEKAMLSCSDASSVLFQLGNIVEWIIPFPNQLVSRLFLDVSSSLFSYVKQMLKVVFSLTFSFNLDFGSKYINQTERDLI